MKKEQLTEINDFHKPENVELFIEFKNFLEYEILRDLGKLTVEKRGAIRNSIRYAESIFVLKEVEEKLVKEYNLVFDVDVLFKIFRGDELDKEYFKKFKSKELINEIKKELDKGHLGDDKQKFTNFLSCVSGLLKNQKDRVSNKISGGSADGKSNLILNNLKHMPTESYFYLTNATQSTIEDDIKDKRIIALNELNMNSEYGSNKHLIEIIKQKTEGGTSSLKKDLRTGMKTARYEIGEQASITYSTVEAENEEQVKTRFIDIGIKSTYKKIKNVNDNTLNTVSDLNKLSELQIKEDSWIKKGLTYFFNKKEQFEFWIPYAKFLIERINKKDIFDNNDPRSKRDIKRLLALTKAMTYLYQEQREVIEHSGHLFLKSEPQDFINTLNISGDFFNQSYSGLDNRVLNVLKVIDEYKQEWTPRDYIQEKINVTRNTIKSYCKILSSEGCIKGIKGSQLNNDFGTNTYDGNKIYYQRCQKDIKKPLINCQISELKKFLEEKTEHTIDTFDEIDLPSINDIDDVEKDVKK